MLKMLQSYGQPSSALPERELTPTSFTAGEPVEEDSIPGPFFVVSAKTTDRGTITLQQSTITRRITTTCASIARDQGAQQHSVHSNQSCHGGNSTQQPLVATSSSTE